MKHNVAKFRDEIACAIRSVRLSCFGRKCLKDCQRRMAAAAPRLRAARRRWGVAVAAALLCLGANAIDGFGGITCQWHRELGQYLCEGTGNQIWVTSGSDQVITNIFGGCTNCINVTPETCRQIKSDVETYYTWISDGIQSIEEACHVLEDLINHERDDIATFRRFGPLSANNSISGVVRAAFTNYMLTVENTQTQMDRAYLGTAWNQSLRGVIYNDGIYDYANTHTKSLLDTQYRGVNRIQENVGDISFYISELNNTVQYNLNCESCPGGDGDGTNDCNQCTGGRWCTEEQGDAIIELLTDTKDYVEKMKAAVISISNNVQIAVQNLHDGFFTSYTHIPTEEDLGHSWQELYLEGYSPNFHEYANTNILARIELLLAGMSGVLTNSSDFAEAGEFAEGGMSFTNAFDSVREDFTNSVGLVVTEREKKVRSVGDALIGLYNTFRGWSGTPFSRTTLIGSYSFEIGEQHWDVPSFEPSPQGIAVANILRVICRSVMSVVYILFTVAVFVRFHIAFFQWVLKYLKWGIELMQGLFA